MVAFMSLAEMTPDEREDLLETVSGVLIESSVEARREDLFAYVENARSLSFALQCFSKELSAEQFDAATILLQQAMMMIFVFRQRNLYPADAFLH
jgi:hypothetical protein